jgi:hypothetical protein
MTMIATLLAAASFLLPNDPSPEEVKAAVRKALPLLEKSSGYFTTAKSCFSCHHQALPVYALTQAKKKGFPIDEANYAKQLRHTADHLDRNREEYKKGRGQGGQTATATYALWTLDTGRWKPDETTAAAAEYLLLSDRGRDYWQPPSNRPPSEASAFTDTAFAIRSLQVFGTAAQKERVEARIARAREWLLQAKPKDTEDRVFRLWGLFYAEGDARAAVQDLVAGQREDGGWSQLPDLESDAYATGSSLVALREAGGVPASDPVYRKGLGFLLRTQREDGTWHVKTRSKPIQPYFESGFPYTKDQFISATASGWATAALALACP